MRRFPLLVRPLLAGLVAAVVALSSGCGTGPINLNIPMNRLDSPEANGRPLAGRLALGHRSTDQVTLTPDYGTVSVNSSRPRVGAYASWGADGSLGILERLDASLKLTADAPYVLEIKYQLLGETAQNSRPGNLSLAVVGGGGLRTNQDSGVNTFFGGQTASYDVSWSVLNLGLVTGYRLSPTVLGYTGYTWTRMSYSGSQVQFNGTRSSWSGQGTQHLFHLGMIAHLSGEEKTEKARFFAQLEGELAALHVGGGSGTNPNGALTLGLSW